MPVWVQYLQALTVPAIAALGIYIAWRQWLTAHDKLKLDLFNRRLDAYRGLRDAVAPVTASGVVRNQDSDAFAQAMYEMHFLFDKAMERDAKEIYEALLKKHALDLQLGRAVDKEKALKSQELFASITKGIYHDMPERMEKFMRFRSGL